jgi:hypothetical protein
MCVLGLLATSLLLGRAAAQLGDGECTAPIDASLFEDLLLNQVGLDEATPYAVQAPLVTTSPTPDGVINPGEYPNMCYYSFADHENPGNPWPSLDNLGAGDDDLTMTMYLAHSSEYLYLGFTIKDDFLDFDEGVFPFLNDSVELFINPDLDLADSYGPGKMQLITDAAGEGDAEFNNRFAEVAGQGLQFAFEPNPPAGELYSIGLVLPDESGYVVEWQIPLGSLDKDGAFFPADTPMATGDVLLFNVAIDDNDEGENLGGQNGHHILWQVPGANSPFGGGEPIWVVPLALTEGVVAVPGDFDNSGQLDAADIDDLTGQSAGGTNLGAYDLNSDAAVNEADVRVWIRDLFNSWVGDADLNGEFNSSDLVAVLASGTYEADVPSVWSTGDFNGDGRTNSGDLVAALADGGYEAGPRTAVAAIPEPAAMSLAMLAGLALVRCRRRR